MHLFFDLDGTLTDPGVGIVRCIEHALVGLGRPVPPAATLMRCIGPPLRDSFSELLSSEDGALLDEAIALYRERFSAVGLFENEVYPGVLAGLKQLCDMGHALWIVTSKPTVYARRIVEHFELEPFFRAVYGSELSGLNADKKDLIRHVLGSEPIGERLPWMIGDRMHDVLAAHENGLWGVGVLWGYGTESELRGAAADQLVASMEELCAIVAAQQRDAADETGERQ